MHSARTSSEKQLRTVSRSGAQMLAVRLTDRRWVLREIISDLHDFKIRGYGAKLFCLFY